MCYHHYSIGSIFVTCYERRVSSALNWSIFDKDKKGDKIGHTATRVRIKIMTCPLFLQCDFSWRIVNFQISLVRFFLVKFADDRFCIEFNNCDITSSCYSGVYIVCSIKMEVLCVPTMIWHHRTFWSSRRTAKMSETREPSSANRVRSLCRGPRTLRCALSSADSRQSFCITFHGRACPLANKANCSFYSWW